MNINGLQALVDEIRNGRPEDTTTEWKRQWWDLRNPRASAEFIKDVSAMANANTKDDRVIVLGIDENGNLQNAPPPEDEANLQQKLQAIEPIPNVVFGTLVLAGLTISMIEIRAPFDRPYVARCDGRNTIFVRQGSRITTATRAMLDRWYLESRKTAELRLLLQGHEVSGNLPAFEFPRSRHVPEPDRPEQKWLQSMLRTTDPVQVADSCNREIWLKLELNNVSTEAATHVVIDLVFSPVDQVRLWYDSIFPVPGQRWQTNPDENCYVEDWGAERGSGHVRQRLARVNPQTSESLVPVALWSTNDAVGQPLPVTVSFRVTDHHGERLAGEFQVKAVFDGTEKIVKPAPAF